MMKVESIRQARGNQDRNYELQMKADELEKVFQQYKLQPSRNTNTQKIESSSIYRKYRAEKTKESDVEFHSIGDEQQGLNPPIISKGKLYNRYMELRDAKLREEGFQHKQEKMRAMHESLERARAEMIMTTKFAEDRQHLRTVRVTSSYTITSAMKNTIVQPWTETVKNRHDEYLPEFQQQNRNYDGSSRSSQPKKLVRNKTLSSSSTAPSTSTASAPPIPRPSVKSSISFSARRRVQPEIPLPYLSGPKRENHPNPLSMSNKVPTQSQFTSKHRSKSTSESHSSYRTYDNDDESFIEQAQSSGSSIPALPVNFKSRKDHVSGSSIKAPKSFFSLSSLRGKGSNSKPR